jgi:16S rRNA (guanine(1405)-N(7))-methyltransferase
MTEVGAASEAQRLDELVRLVLVAPKYRHFCEEVVSHLGRRELAARRSLHEAIKATKNRLHQIAGIYLEPRLDFGAALADLRQAKATPESWREACRRVMGMHLSTRERLPLIESFYMRCLDSIPPPSFVLDVGCGLNPLAIPWMPLAPGAAYHGYDVYTDMSAFLSQYLRLAEVAGQAIACDVTGSPPTQRADLALLLKTLPCLEHLGKGAGLRLLDALPARHMLVSFPVRGVSGKSRSMRQGYEARFLDSIRDRPWQVQEFSFASELAFLVTKP